MLNSQKMCSSQKDQSTNEISQIIWRQSTNGKAYSLSNFFTRWGQYFSLVFIIYQFSMFSLLPGHRSPFKALEVL